MTDAVELASLGALGTRLGVGAQAEIFEVPDARLPGTPVPVVYKRYKDSEAAPPGLASIVAFRRRLDDAGRAKLDGAAAWPLCLVRENSEVRGVLLRRIPDDYGHWRTLPGSGTKKRCLQEIQNLFIDPKLAARLGIPVPGARERLALCRSFARALQLLHQRDVVFGDINAKNAVYRLGGAPDSVMLVDCDAVRFRGSISRQLNAPDWNPPEGDVLTHATDRYKFGLFVLRCLAPGAQASTGRDPQRASGALDVEGLTLLARGLGTAPTDRPTIREWGRYLHWRVTGTRIAEESAPAAPPGPPAPNARKGRRRDGTGHWVPVT